MLKTSETQTTACENQAVGERLYEIVTEEQQKITVFCPSGVNSYTPARTLLFFLPSQKARNTEDIHKWLSSSGWLQQAEKDGSVLVVPHCTDNWKEMSPHCIPVIYQALWGKVPSPEKGDYVLDKKRIEPKVKVQAKVWMWETLWSILGFEDGADFAGDCVVAHPNRFASVTLIDGVPHDFAKGEEPSDHFLVSKTAKGADRMIGVSGDYAKRMRNLPSAVWLVSTDTNQAVISKAMDYFKKCDDIAPDADAKRAICCGMPTLQWFNDQEPAQRLWISEGEGSRLSPQQVMDTWIGPSIRWKNSPDGTLKTFFWKDQIESGTAPYRRHTFRVPGEGTDREYYAYVPDCVRPQAPVMISIHGHGEPAWMFLSKNGWPQLADRVGMIVISPESQAKNRWIDEIDTDSFPFLVKDICKRYDVDAGRIYLSGFSNGNKQCYNAGTKHSGLFAGMFPMSRAAGDEESLRRLRQNKMAMPLFGVTGDNDGWCVEHPEKPDSEISHTVETFCNLAGCELRPAEKPSPLYWQPAEERSEEFYREKYGLKEADRFRTWVYRMPSGKEIVAITVMKNMPHGSIWDEATAAWEFLKSFRRLPDGTLVQCDDV